MAAAPMSDARFNQIAEMRFTTGLNAACGHFDTDVERELYREGAKHQNARVELVREVARLRAEVEQLRTERSHLDGLYQDAERHVGELLGLDDPAVGVATLACNCAAEPVHQTGCAGAAGGES